MQSVMLACSRFRGSHTGDAIAEEYETVVASFHYTASSTSVVLCKVFKIKYYGKYLYLLS